MKAIILAAGKGERLKEITDTIPKPMLKYKGKPLIEHNIILFKKFGVKEIFINTHHLSHIIKSYFGNGDKLDVSITYSFEKELLGTSGALKNFQSLIGKEHFFVIYGDNYTEFNLDSLVRKASSSNAIAIIAFHYRDDVSSSGVAEFDEDYRIIKFIEKPQPGETDSHWVSAGIFYLSPEIFKYIPDGFSDFGRDIFPLLIKNNLELYGVCTKAAVKYFDTIEILKKNISYGNFT